MSLTSRRKSPERILDDESSWARRFCAGLKKREKACYPHRYFCRKLPLLFSPSSFWKYLFHSDPCLFLGPAPSHSLFWLTLPGLSPEAAGPPGPYLGPSLFIFLGKAVPPALSLALNLHGNEETSLRPRRPRSERECVCVDPVSRELLASLEALRMPSQESVSRCLGSQVGGMAPLRGVPCAPRALRAGVGKSLNC